MHSSSSTRLFSIQPHTTYLNNVEKYVEWGCELFYAIIPQPFFADLLFLHLVTYLMFISLV